MATINDLEKACGKSKRTIRRWQEKELIPKPRLVAHPSGNGVRGEWDDSVIAACVALAEAPKQLAEAPPKKRKDTQIAPRNTDIYEFTKLYSGQLQHSDYLLTYETSRKASTEYNYIYGLFEEALDKDEHLSAVMKQRTMAVLSRERRIMPDDETPRAKYAAAFIQEVFDTISQRTGDAGFGRDLSELMEAIPHGLAISEIMWGERTIKFKPEGASNVVTREDAYVPDALLSRAPRRFGYDNEGNLLLNTIEAPDGIKLPDRKFLVFRPYTRHEDPYGLPQMRVIWWATWFKRIVRRMWLKFLERYGDPLVAVTPKFPLPEDEKAEIKKAIAGMQVESGWLLPPECNASLLEAQRYGTIASYEDFIKHLNMEITKAILGQTTTLDVPGDGNRATGEVTQQVALALTQQDARALEALINGTLIPWIMDYNLPGYPMPKLMIDTDPPKDLFGRVKVDRNLWEMGFDFPVSYVENYYGVKIAADGEDKLPSVSDVQGRPFESSGQPNPLQPANSSTIPGGKRNATGKKTTAGGTAGQGT